MVFQLIKRKVIGPILVPVTATGATGAVQLWREGDVITCDLNGITLPEGTRALHVVQLPLGYRPVGAPVIPAIGTTEPVINSASWIASYWNGRLTWVGRPDGTLERPVDGLRGVGTWRTTDPQPDGGA